MSWDVVQLSKVCQIDMGSAPKGSTYVELGKGTPLIAGAADYGDIYPRPKKATTEPTKLCKKDDIIICVRATIGDLNWADKEYCLGRGVAGLRVNAENLDSMYLWYFIASYEEELYRNSTGSTFPQINKKIIESILIPLPPLETQRKIASVLEKADQLRKDSQKMEQELNSLAQSVFIDMFGDPVTNPKGWEDTTLGNLIEFAKDGPHVSPKYSENGIPFLSTRHIKPSGVRWFDLKYLSNEEVAIHWKKCKPQRGDVLYTKGGTTGIACPVDFDTEFAVWVHVALLRPIAVKVNHIWLANMLNTLYCYNQSQKNTRGATNKDLGLTRMIHIKMYLPPLEKQKRYSAFVESVNEQLLETIKLKDQHENLFNSLMQKAFKGELNLNNNKL
jgi:type I restriction enzyme S subunit